MSRFYGEVKGRAKTKATQGTETSSVFGHVRGWDVGVAVHGRVGPDGEDWFDVDLTGGSNAPGTKVPLGTFRRADLDRMRKGGR